MTSIESEDEIQIPPSLRQELLDIVHLLGDGHGDREARQTPATHHKALEASTKLLGLLPHLPSQAALKPASRLELIEKSADAYFAHYEHTKEFEALESACDCLIELASEIDEDDLVATARIKYKNSRYLCSRFLHYKNEKDLENATKLARDSIDETEISGGLINDVALLAERKLQLCFCLCAQATLLGEYEPEPMEEAITINNEIYACLQGRQEGERLFIEAMESLSNSLLIRWRNSPVAEKSSNIGDFQRAIQLVYEVHDMILKQDEPEATAESLSNTSFILRAAYHSYINHGILLDGYTISGMEQLGHVALQKLAESLEYESAPWKHIDHIMLFAESLSEYPHGPREELLAGLYPMLKKGVELLRDILYISLPDDRRQHLNTFYGLPRYAAAAALQSNASACEALQVLEQGRAVTMSMQLGLEDNEPEADEIPTSSSVRKYNKAKATLFRSVSDSEPFHERYTKLKAFYDTLQDAQDDLPAEETLKYLDESYLKLLASDAVKIVINITDIRCDAFIVAQSGITVLPLPNLVETELAERSWEVQQGLAKIDEQPSLYSDLYENLSKLLKWLWKVLAQPVLDVLGYKARKSDWPHVTWIPTGVLSLYPIHAAGLGLHKKSNVMNRVISNYAPTLKVLAAIRSRKLAQSSLPHQDNHIQPTVITMATTPNRPDLELGDIDFAAVQKHFPHASRLHQPTGSAVLSSLNSATASSIVHISTHSEVDYDFPSKSLLLLQDWQENPLTLSMLRQSLKRQGASGRYRLTFLSSCFTANGGIEGLQDEAEHIASTMLVAGFGSVVGGLWAVEERAASVVTEGFYRHLKMILGDGELDAKGVSEALHLAVWDLARSTTEGGQEGDPVQWARFVCFGS